MPCPDCEAMRLSRDEARAQAAEWAALRVCKVERERDTLKALLREVEWVDDAPWILAPQKQTYRACPSCGRTEADGHASDCRLHAALAQG